MPLFRRKQIVPVLRLTGAIGAGRLGVGAGGLTLASTAQAIERAFSLSKLPAVVVIVNSPGGSPVQSNLIYQRLRAHAAETRKRIYVFCEDAAASGGYFLAQAGDEIYADPSSIIGSIGVISAGFGFQEAMARFGVERRVHTSGADKGALDPFRPERADDVALITAIQRDIHDVFIGVVKERRAGKLKAPDSELFSGAFWSAPKALDLGLIDGVADARGRMREVFGTKVQLVTVPLAKAGLFSRLRGGQPGSATEALASATDRLPDAVVSALETRALWARLGL